MYPVNVKDTTLSSSSSSRTGDIAVQFSQRCRKPREMSRPQILPSGPRRHQIDDRCSRNLIDLAPFVPSISFARAHILSAVSALLRDSVLAPDSSRIASISNYRTSSLSSLFLGSSASPPPTHPTLSPALMVIAALPFGLDQV